VGFEVLCEKFLEILGGRNLRPATIRAYTNCYRNCAGFLGNTPVAQIDFGTLEDLVAHLGEKLSHKTIYDTLSFLKTFLRWCRVRGYLRDIPEMPRCSREMGMRDILDKKTQKAVLETIRDLYWESAPSVYIGILLLATYPKIRPAELRQVECKKHIDLEGGWITIPSPKESKNPKRIKLIKGHIELLREHINGKTQFYLLSFPSGKRMGRDYLYAAWKKACMEMGIVGVSLYPGTKHTTATDLAKKFPYKMVKEAAGITSEAMERYLNFTELDVVSLYEEANPL